MTLQNAKRLLSRLWIVLIVAVACGPQPTPIPSQTPASTRIPQPTRTPVNIVPPALPTVTTVFGAVTTPITFPTAIVPPTVVPTGPYLLTGGRGLTTGATMSNGEFQVEGYCTILNPSYGVDEDGERWYCTQNGERVLALGTAELDDICFRTYGVAGAYAQQIPGNQPAAYRWRCFANN